MTRSLHSPAYRKITQALKAMRQEAGLSQRELAAKLQRELSFISRIEQGQRRLDLLEWTRFCEALGRDPVEEGKKLIAGLRRDKSSNSPTSSKNRATSRPASDRPDR